MTNETEQIKFWQGEFGKEFTNRNLNSVEDLDESYVQTWGVSRTSLNQEFLAGLDRDIKILEVGCNIGQQLRHLQLMGFRNLFGIEIQRDAVERAKISTKDINILSGSAFDIPFKDNWFDLVFTSGVLIHIHPKDLNTALNEINRCTKQYIWGFEYFSDKCEEINYRGHDGFLWKQDFCGLYLNSFPQLEVVKEKKIKYLKEDNTDQMFLLEKK